MDNKTLALVAMVITALLATGFTVNKFSENDPASTHVCESEMMLKYCDHLSGSGLTCYPQADSRKGSKVCDGGWKSLDQFGLPVKDSAEEKQLVSPGVGSSDKICCPVNAPCYAMVGNGC